MIECKDDPFDATQRGLAIYEWYTWQRDRQADFDRERAKKLLQWEHIHAQEDGPTDGDVVEQSSRIKNGVEAQRRVALEKLNELYLEDPIKKIGGEVGGAIIGGYIGLPSDDASQLIEDAITIGEGGWSQFK